MSRNGSGVYTPPVTDFPAVASTLIESTKFNNTINDIGAAITGSVAADGQTTITANLPMASHKLTGLSAGVTAGDSVRYEQVAKINGSGANTDITSLGTLNKAANVASYALTIAATIATDATLGNVFTGVLNQAGHTLSNPTGLVSGGTYMWCLDQDATGGRTITSYGNKFLWAYGIVPTLSTAANAKDIISCVCDAAGNLRCTLVLGFA